MATAAQIEANRRNAQKSTGPRTDAGKDRSRLNGLEHGCRSNLLVLPTEEFGAYETELQSWKLCLQPRNPAEDLLVERMVGLDCLRKRIRRAETGRLNKRIARGGIEEANRENEQVIALTQRLFPDGCLPKEFQSPPAETMDPRGRDEARGRGRDHDRFAPIDPDHPQFLINQLKYTITGCRWLLEQWSALRELVAQGRPWLASDKLKAVRLLGRRPTEAHDWPEVVEVFLATHVLAGQGGDPFQELLDELPPEQAPRYADCLKRRGYYSCIFKDAADAKRSLLAIIDRAIEPIERSAGVLNDVAEALEPYEADRLSWDDTPEGERLRRYELTCSRTWFRLFDMLYKVRNEGGRLDFATVASIGQPIRVSRTAIAETNAPGVATARSEPDHAVSHATAPTEPNFPMPPAPTEPNFPAAAAPTEANFPMPPAPSEAIFLIPPVPSEANRPAGAAPSFNRAVATAQSPSHSVGPLPLEQPKASRVDRPHFGREARGRRMVGRLSGPSALERVLGGGGTNLLDLAGLSDRA